ncbi:FCD domain-containing protein [Sphingomonas cavernae]|uniref:FCD domain-containing protein n=1 Tax=Sphingomonas cavernae TaxID=2320861 RepID=A0A418WRG1_9SPHN|nr:FCD domain-containing protein [Sphingomonas cavernae]RJF93786.1 FCD domain-containing protein [Sphingomonas cavernae]
MTANGTQRRNLVATTADRLRDLVFAAEPDSLVGALQDLAKALDVGIVTIQQAARVLEHEGLLEARRGPGGGYYGRRPDAAALERSIAAYLRSNPTSFEEAVNITSLLFNELVPAAADCADAALRAELEQLSRRLENCNTASDCGRFESDFQDLLFRMVDWPLFKLLTVVTLRVGVTKAGRLLRGSEEAVADWREGRQRIISAILRSDRELARFEADRSNRRVVLQGMREHAST